MNLFGFGTTETPISDFGINIDLKMTIASAAFIEAKGQSIYRRIFTGCLNRTKGLPPDDYRACLDNPSEDSNNVNGLISLMADAMQSKKNLEIVYKEGIIRKALNTDDKKDIIKFNFAPFFKTVDLVNFWLAFLYEIIKASYTGIKMSQAIIIKYAKMRESIARKESSYLQQMGTAIKNAIIGGAGAAIDAEDQIMTVAFNFEPTKASMAAYFTLIANELMLPSSEITGEFTSGIGTTGEVDVEALDEAYRKWWSTPFLPIIMEVFKNKDIKFKTNNWRKLQGNSDTLIAIENSGLISDEKKKELANELFE